MKNASGGRGACQPSHTNFRARENHAKSLKSGTITTVDLWPVTGRRHQLRRHLAGIGHPVLGDRKYTAGNIPLIQGEGLFLWSVGLRLKHPISGEQLDFSIPEPNKFELWRERESRRWEQFEGTTDEVARNGDQDMDGSKNAPDKRETIVNQLPEVKGLRVEERDGFRYYQYDWSAVGGPPSPLSIDDVDQTITNDDE